MLKTLISSMLLTWIRASMTMEGSPELQIEMSFEVAENGTLYLNPSAHYLLNDTQIENMLKSIKPEDVKDARILNLNGHNITKIPRNLAETVPNVAVLHIGFSDHLTTIGSDDLKPLEKLDDIFVEDANIKTISRDTFKGVESIKGLYISRNQTKLTIEGEAFTGLPNLGVLSFLLNKIETIGSNTFVGLRNLTFLTLKENEIEEIGAGAFRELPKLEILFLKDNKIGKIDPDAFEGVYSLRILHIDNDTFKKIDPKTFVELLPKLEEVRLYKNKIDEATINELKEKRPNLRIIDVDTTE